MRALSKSKGYTDWWGLDGASAYTELIEGNRLLDKEFGVVGYAINNKNYSNCLNKPIVRYTFKKGDTLFSLQTAQINASSGASWTIPDVSDIFNPEIFSKVEDDQGTAVTSNGVVWSGTMAIHTQGFKVTANTEVILYFVDDLVAFGSAQMLVTLNAGWNYVPYNMMQDRSIYDTGILGFPSIITHISDGNGKSIRYDGSEWSGNLTTLQFGRAYKMYKATAGSITSVFYNTLNDDNYYPSATIIPEYINDIPRKYEDAPTNWLWDDNFAIGKAVNPGNISQYRVYHSRAKTWSNRYMLGDKIKYVMYDEENAKYKYQVLPPGENDWMLAFTSQSDAFYCCGAVRLSDVEFSDLLESDTYINPDDWKPYTNPDHMALLTNPENYDTAGTTYGKYIQSYIDVQTQSISGTHPHFPMPEDKVFFMMYDSVLNKYYWMKEVFSGTNNVVRSTIVTAEDDVTHHNKHMDNSNSFPITYDSSARDLIPVKAERIIF